MEAPVRRMSREARHQQILDVACALFAEKGVENTTAKDIADQIGTSITLIFQHFDGIDAIYDELFEKWAEELKTQVRLPVIDNSAIKSLRYCAELFVHAQYSSEEFHKVIGRTHQLEAAIYSKHGSEERRNIAIREGSDLVANSIMPLVVLGQMSGEIVDGDPYDIATLFYATIIGVGAMNIVVRAQNQMATVELLLSYIAKKESVDNTSSAE